MKRNEVQLIKNSKIFPKLQLTLLRKRIFLNENPRYGIETL